MTKLKITAALVYTLPMAARSQPVMMRSTGTIIIRPAEDILSAAPVIKPGPVAAPVPSAQAVKTQVAVSSSPVKATVEKAALQRTTAVPTPPAAAVSAASKTAISTTTPSVVKPAAGKPAAAAATGKAAVIAEASDLSARLEVSTAAAPESKSAGGKPAALSKTVIPAAAPVIKAKAGIIAAAPEQGVKSVIVISSAARPDAAAAPAGLPYKPGFAVTKRHSVVERDTLWDLSQKYYGDPFQWGVIYEANRDKVSDPDLLYPGEELSIPRVSEDIRPKPVTVQPAPAAAAPEKAAPAAEEKKTDGAAPPPAEQAPLSVPARAMKEKSPDFEPMDLSEEMPEDQKEWTDNLLRIVPDDWKEEGVIIAMEGGNDSMDDGLTEKGDHVRLKVRDPAAFRPGDVLPVYLRGANAYDKHTGMKLGRELQRTGTLEVLGLSGDYVEARIRKANTSVDKGQVIGRN
jgi:nucleoid-associated protein YgaU